MIGEIVVHTKPACQVTQALYHCSHSCPYHASIVCRTLLLEPAKSAAIDDEMHIRCIGKSYFKHPLVVERGNCSCGRWQWSRTHENGLFVAVQRKQVFKGRDVEMI